jgi:hypothetical protein
VANECYAKYFIMFRKILKYLLIVQEVDNGRRKKQGLKILGRGYSKAYRFNPYNPLSYIVLIIILIVGILMFGLYGFWKETTTLNPFRWD